MRAACLIPTTRPETIETAKASAEADGWDVLIEWDRERRGVSLTRNILFDRARDAGYDVIRYMDDDDVVLPHREACLDVIRAGFDVAYHDAVEIENGIRTPLNQIKDPEKVFFFPPDTWGWVARVDAMERVRQASTGGLLWPDIPLGEAFFLFLEMVRNRLKMKHVPIQAYEYRVGTGLHNLGGTWDGQILMEKYRVEAFKLHMARLNGTA